MLSGFIRLYSRNAGLISSNIEMHPISIFSIYFFNEHLILPLPCKKDPIVSFMVKDLKGTPHWCLLHKTKKTGSPMSLTSNVVDRKGGSSRKLCTSPTSSFGMTKNSRSKYSEIYFNRYHPILSCPTNEACFIHLISYLTCKL